MSENKDEKDIIPLEEGVQLFARKNGTEGFPDIAPLLNEIIEKINSLDKECVKEGEIRKVLHKIALAKLEYEGTVSTPL